MLHPDIHVLLHKNQHRERMKQVEDERLVQLVSPAIQMQAMMELSCLISKWWTRRHQMPSENHVVEGKVVMP